MLVGMLANACLNRNYLTYGVPLDMTASTACTLYQHLCGLGTLASIDHHQGIALSSGSSSSLQDCVEACIACVPVKVAARCLRCY